MGNGSPVSSLRQAVLPTTALERHVITPFTIAPQMLNRLRVIVAGPELNKRDGGASCREVKKCVIGTHLEDGVQRVGQDLS